MSAELIDAANELVEQNIQIALANRRTFSNAISATHCADCGDELDQRRREAVPGCQLCVDCIAKQELLAKQRGVM